MRKMDNKGSLPKMFPWKNVPPLVKSENLEYICYVLLHMTLFLDFELKEMNNLFIVQSILSLKTR